MTWMSLNSKLVWGTLSLRSRLSYPAAQGRWLYPIKAGCARKGDRAMNVQSTQLVFLSYSFSRL